MYRKISVLLVGLLLMVFSAPPVQATSQGQGVRLGTVTTHYKDGSTLTVSTERAASLPCCSTYLSVSGAANTGHQMCLKYGVTTVCEYVYKRSWRACEPLAGGLAYDCMAGSFVFSEGIACATHCHEGGLYGSQSCDDPGDRAMGYTMDITGCDNYRWDVQPAPTYWSNIRAWKRVKFCIYTGVDCSTYLFHVDLFGTGGVSGPANGG